MGMIELKLCVCGSNEVNWVKQVITKVNWAPGTTRGQRPWLRECFNSFGSPHVSESAGGCDLTNHPRGLQDDESVQSG